MHAARSRPARIRTLRPRSEEAGRETKLSTRSAAAGLFWALARISRGSLGLGCSCFASAQYSSLQEQVSLTGVFAIPSAVGGLRLGNGAKVGLQRSPSSDAPINILLRNKNKYSVPEISHPKVRAGFRNITWRCTDQSRTHDHVLRHSQGLVARVSRLGARGSPPTSPLRSTAQHSMAL